MREELDKILVEKYPKIFRDRYASMQKTCMCWGFDHGDGWFEIIDAMCSSIQHHIDHIRRQHPELSDEEFDEQYQVVAVQVKQKFGGLRFYANNCDDYVYGVISMAETISWYICENCGSAGAGTKSNSTGWITMLCDNCHSKNQSRTSS